MAETIQHSKHFGWMYAIMGVIALIGGIYSLDNRIHGLAPQLLSLDNTPFAESDEQLRLKELAALQVEDSDSDGINDFNELYVYYTSIYLEDTDSDGISDSDEISNGTDPNCKEGQVCNQVRALAGEFDAADVTTTLGTSGELSILHGDDLTPEAVKSELLKMGIPASTFSNVSDEDLVQVYQSVMNDIPESDISAVDYSGNDISVDEVAQSQGDQGYEDLLYNNDTAGENSLASFTTLEDFRNLDVSQVRELLIQSGMPSSDLEGISDEEVMSLYNSVLEEQLAIVQSE